MFYSNYHNFVYNDDGYMQLKQNEVKIFIYNTSRFMLGCTQIQRACGTNGGDEECI
jgi:hypothetical protein